MIKCDISHHHIAWVGSQVSSWKTLCGSMPQGSRLGPLSFIVMIDDLRANCEVHKFVDDTTLSELIPPPNSPNPTWETILVLYLSTLPTMTCSLTHPKPRKWSLVASTQRSSLPFQLQLAQYNALIHSSCLVFILMLVYPGRLTLTP